MAHDDDTKKRWVIGEKGVLYLITTLVMVFFAWFLNHGHFNPSNESAIRMAEYLANAQLPPFCAGLLQRDPSAKPG